MPEKEMIPLDLLRRLSPEDPMNQDEMWRCIWCGGTSTKDHNKDFPEIDKKMSRRDYQEKKAIENLVSGMTIEKIQAIVNAEKLKKRPWETAEFEGFLRKPVE